MLELDDTDLTPRQHLGSLSAPGVGLFILGGHDYTHVKRGDMKILRDTNITTLIKGKEDEGFSCPGNQCKVIGDIVTVLVHTAFGAI